MKKTMLLMGLMTAGAAFATTVTGTGGTVTYDGDYVIHTFTNDDTFVFSGGEVEVLLVGGGGGGGSGLSGGGGGGAGGFVHKERLSLWKDSFPIRVGKGGAGCPSWADCQSNTPSLPENGGDTEAFGLIAHGGGHGANTASAIGADGASGGGGANKYLTNTRQCNAGGQNLYAEEGYAGGSSTNALTSGGNRGHVHCWSGGGGGAGEAGADGVCTVEKTDWDTLGLAGKGGDGLPCAITGENLYYAGGGGGGFADYSGPSEEGTVSGGQGGGGAGSGARTSGTPWSGINGTDGFGGGGGGGGAFGNQKFGAGGNGGCGTVIVRYRRELPDEESFVAEGADVSYDDDVTAVIYTFKNNGTFSVAGGALVDVLLVGGGGGGGSGLSGGGGGGAGGFIYHQSQYVADGTYEIVVGEGGAGGQPVAGDDAATDAENGGSSEAFGLLAHGGGAGGRGVKFDQTPTMSGKDGGSGGGAAPYFQASYSKAYPGGSAVEGEGFGGGSSTNMYLTEGSFIGMRGNQHAFAGGGGGAGAPGEDAKILATGDDDATIGYAGKGGDGRVCAITGTEVWYAGGGGGGYADRRDPPDQAGTVAGGKGGGGAGSGGRISYSPFPGCDGTDGLGGGGGGGAFSGQNNAAGGKGGKGVVIVRCRYRVRPFEKVSTEGAKRSRDGDYRVYTFTNNGTITVTGDSVVDVLLVGGGGGGGSGRTGGGGGGAGGFLYKTNYVLTNGTYQIVVGDGGAGGADYLTDAENGGDTHALGFSVHGGGAGGRGINTAGGPGADGASGGGGASQYQSGRIVTSPGGVGIETEGCGGGCSTNEMVFLNNVWTRGNVHCYAGGGGGAGAKGADAWIVKSGDVEADIVGAAGRGGDGLPCSITGKEVYYAGGGGGGYADKTDPSEAGTVEGGLGGGGKGSGAPTKAGTAPWNGLPGEDGFGGGGGGAGAYGDNYGGVGGKGGAGTVIIRCQVVPSGNGLMLLFR